MSTRKPGKKKSGKLKNTLWNLQSGVYYFLTENIKKKSTSTFSLAACNFSQFQAKIEKH